MKLQNVMEDFVTQKLREVLDDLDCCKCKLCQEDIATYALNRLKPKYVRTDKGRVFAKVDTLSNQFEIDLLAAIYEGAAIVRAHPHHDVSVSKQTPAPLKR